MAGNILVNPYIETSFEEPVIVKPLCNSNENLNKRHTCAFEKVKDWATKNGEKTLDEILNGNYVYDDYYRNRPYVW